MAALNMALFRNFNKTKNTLRLLVASVHNDIHNESLFKELEKKKMKDMPVKMESPFVKEKPKCLLCQYDIEPDYKNVRMLSQFVSRFTGRIYGRHITGLCEYRQKQVETEITKARKAGLMGYYEKNPEYYQDPDLYDPTRPLRPHPY